MPTSKGGGNALVLKTRFQTQNEMKGKEEEGEKKKRIENVCIILKHVLYLHTVSSNIKEGKRLLKVIDHCCGERLEMKARKKVTGNGVNA